MAHLRDKEKRYSELRKEIPDVTERTLSLQLKQLKCDGLVSRHVFGDKPPIKVVYKLTDLGLSFIPVLDAIVDWGNIVVDEYDIELDNSCQKEKPQV